MLKHYLLALLLAISFRPAYSAVFYVAPTGSDANSGTITAPFLTIQRGQAAVVAGDTVYVRGGTYLMQNTNISGHSTAAAGSYAYITLLNKSGTAGARINYWAYPGEQPVFDYSNVDPSILDTNPTANPNAVPPPYRLTAFEVSGAYIYLRGLEIIKLRVPVVAPAVNTLSICVSQSGAVGNNIFERLSMHDGQAIGFYMTRGRDNLILNCDAYRNNDNVNVNNNTGTANGGNVDGFGAHVNMATYTGNVFRGCRAWQNSDDGFDCINNFAAVTFENCWAFYNGYTQNFVSRGDGNGFKAGGFGTGANPSVPNPIPRNVTQGCVSVRNKANGFYANHHLGGLTFVDNTAYRNGSGPSSANFNMLNRSNVSLATNTDVPGYSHIVQNNISYLPSVAGADLTNCDATTSTVDHNTFAPNSVGVTVSSSDFLSLDTTQLRAPRQANGSLPIIPTLRLASGSGLIDAGTTANYPASFTYTGSAPDVGAYEYANLWTGTVSTDWFNSANWSGGVPTAAIDALIPGSAPFQPAIASGAATARSLTIGGGTLTMSGGTLDAQGDWQNNGTFAATGGTVVLGTAAQTNGPNILGSSRTRFWNLTVNANGVLLGTAARASVQRVVTLNGALVTQANAFVLESNSTGTAMAVNNGSGGFFFGSVTVQRYIAATSNAGLGYRHFSAPVGMATVGSLTTSTFTPVVNAAYNTSATPAAVTPFPTVYGYDQSRLASVSNNLSAFDKGWVSPSALSDALTVGRGYTVNIGAGQTVSFTGPQNNAASQPITLNLTRNAVGTPNATNAGWQLVGNPFPSPLDYGNVVAADRMGLDPAIYVFESQSQYTGSYRASLNGVGGNANSPSSVLAVGQAFFVRVSDGQTSGTLNFRNAQRLTSYTNPSFLRTAETRPLVQLTLQGNGSSLADDTYVYFENGATDSFEPAYDAVKLPNSTGLNLSASLSGKQLAIDGHGVLGTAQRMVPLAVGVPAPGTYTFTATQLLNLGTVPTYLRDLQTGALIDLAQQPTYQFTVSNATALITGRFELVFSPQRPLAMAPAALVQQVALYPNPATTSAWLELPASLGRQAIAATLLDAVGREVRTSTLPAQGTAAHQLDLHGLAAGVYALRLSTNAGVVVKKLVVE